MSHQFNKPLLYEIWEANTKPRTTMTYAEKLTNEVAETLNIPSGDNKRIWILGAINQAMQAQRKADLKAALHAVDVATRQQGSDPYEAIRNAILNAEVKV